MSKYLLEMQDITKKFPGVVALDKVNFKVTQGEIHALVGENGAGKSTLMNILSGTYPSGTYSGNMVFNNQIVSFKDIKQSEKLGIAIIHQELALSPYLSIAENLFLGNERSRFGIVNWRKTYKDSTTYLHKLGLKESPTMPVMFLGVGKQQIVEIAKALVKNAKLLILDEPTAALNKKESDILLNILLELKQQGVTSILISHHLKEVSEIADSITILRDGKTIETLQVEDKKISEARIIKGMVGREMRDRFPKRNNEIGNSIFEVKQWTVYHPLQHDKKVIDNINFNIRKGEVVGIAGLMGAGRTELAKSLFGKYYGSRITGEIYLHNELLDVSSIDKAIEQGIVYVSEDRKEEGLNLIASVKENITLANIKSLTDHSFINEHKEVDIANRYKESIDIRTPTILQKAGNLSGGNQQKVVLAKWLFVEPEILILDEPTRGIDVGAKYDIYTIINQLAEKNKGCLLISSELEEVIGMSDRIYVMDQGCFIAELDIRNSAQADINMTQEKIMRHIVKNKERA